MDCYNHDSQIKGFFMFSFFRKMKENEFNSGFNAGYTKAREEVTQSRESFRLVEMQMAVGTPVIVVPNEWDNPVVGFAKRIETTGRDGNIRMLVIDNYLSEEIKEVICGGVQMNYSDQRLDVALSLDPYQLWAITAHGSHGFGDFDKPKSGVRWDKGKCMEVLKKNGFFEKWETFQKEKMKDY